MKWKIALAIAVVLVVAYLAASPWLTAYQLRAALEAQDSEALVEHVDFPTLRQNLKDDLNAMLVQETQDEENPFAALGVLLGSAIVDRMVDAFVTPAGLAGLLNAPGRNVLQEDAPVRRRGLTDDLGDTNLQMGYWSINRFDIVATNKETGDQVRFVLRRRGVGWKLTRIRLPEQL